jgi:hypothetical protein
MTAKIAAPVISAKISHKVIFYSTELRMQSLAPRARCSQYLAACSLPALIHLDFRRMNPQACYFTLKPLALYFSPKALSLPPPAGFVWH